MYTDITGVIYKLNCYNMDHLLCSYFSHYFIPQTNTFQCVLASSAMASFVIFLYADGEIQWANNALVGINAGDGINSVTIPGSQTPNIVAITRNSNVGIPGIWLFEVSGGNACI